MSPALTILTILGAVVLGLLLSRVPALGRLPATNAFSAVRMSVLAAMVGAMGFRLGRTEELINSAGTLGLAALLFAAATLAGTLLVLSVVFALRGTGSRSDVSPRNASPPVRWSAFLADPLLFLAMLAAGFLAGAFVPIFPGANGGDLITGLLYVLLLLVGMGLGTSGIRPEQILTHPDLLILPLGAIVGSLAGGLLAGLALNIRPGAAMSLASGFGWYSLSGVLLTKLDGPGLGAVSFLSNMLRESMGLVLIPFLARTRFPLLAIGAGGATSMDVSLVITSRALGEESIPLCLASGGLLSLMVPILVPVCYSLPF